MCAERFGQMVFESHTLTNWYSISLCNASWSLGRAVELLIWLSFWLHYWIGVDDRRNIFRWTRFSSNWGVPDKVWLMPRVKCVSRFVVLTSSKRNRCVLTLNSRYWHSSVVLYRQDGLYFNYRSFSISGTLKFVHAVICCKFSMLKISLFSSAAKQNS